MLNMKHLFVILFIFISLAASAQKEVPFTLDDRDRIIRVEVEQKAIRNEMNSLRNEMNAKFEGIDKQFTFLYWALSILIGLVVINLGYTIWDRRTAIHPIKESLYEEKIEIGKIKTALKEMGESDQKIAEILKRVAIL